MFVSALGTSAHGRMKPRGGAIQRTVGFRRLLSDDKRYARGAKIAASSNTKPTAAMPPCTSTSHFGSGIIFQ